MIKKIALALSLGLTLGACNSIPKCGDDQVIETVQILFYQMVEKALRPPFGKEPTEEDLKFDPFGASRAAQNERKLLKSLNPSDVMVTNIKEVEDVKDRRTCSGSIQAHARMSKLNMFWNITRSKDGFDVELRRW